MDLFVNHCRLCRAENNSTDNWTLLARSGHEQTLEKIHLCTGVRIEADDGLPQRVCRRCEASLDQADTFRRQCQEADAWWRFNFGENVVKPVPITSVYVKPEVVEEDELDSDENLKVGVETVLKEEPENSDDSDYKPVKKEQKSVIKTSKKKEKANPKKRGRTDFRCRVCSKQFLQKSALEEHEARHSGVRNHECTQCDCKFFGVSGLRRHTALRHSTNLPFPCDKCDRMYAMESQLVQHQITHLEARPFSCELCSKAFKTQPQLNAHMRYVHQPQEVKDVQKKAYQKICVCSYCGKISNTLTNHTIHLRIHTGVKKYECQICNKRFTAQWSHRKHMLIHTDERPYQCEHCQKAFRQRHHLTTHIRGVHSNERPFPCRFCPMAFVTRQSMQAHEKTHGEPLVGHGSTQ
ncbi:zinc finger protein 12-like [Culex quinquefasciatus]|uniref:zinc finger protein 12-like n=1 Tax=Culex quinquefasciatus TaxID=7176 RepID=UPI0018E362A4|nr:zinc finger protein 12-like [Culex quinquefasciatus]